MKKLEKAFNNNVELNTVDFNDAYIGLRSDVLNLIPGNVKKVLEIGCSTGALGEQIIKRNNAVVIGIESCEQMATVAQRRLNKVIIGNVEEICLEDYLTHNYFDVIIFADVLEHLKNPWDLLKNIIGFLDDDGVIIASIPNVRHYTTILTLAIMGYWPYRDCGIHDRTHLRFFTLRNIKEMFEGTGMKIIRIERTYRIIETEPKGVFKYLRFLNRFSNYCSIPFLKNFLTFQYLITARKY